MPASGPWPSPGDYSTAIQNPQNCFLDSWLKAGRPTNNRLGLPVGVSGNFAVVYQIKITGKAFAVRCFIRPITDQQQRYLALNQHLSKIHLPTLVDFAYLHKGIIVHGSWYPIVRMEWISGKQLHLYVEKNLQSRQENNIRQLATLWRNVMSGLNHAHMAHGDLQHGNILIDSSGIRLVDYDGFYIPALRGQPPNEVGHPNYQHSQRLEKGYYEENADAFSALVIYLSLLALSADPELWNLHNGENLIFRANDFKNPGQTLVWDQLKTSTDAEVRRLTLALEEFCREPVSTIPDLETILQSLSLKKPIKVLQALPETYPNHVRDNLKNPIKVSPIVPSPTTITCPNCGYVNESTEIYCQRCAHQLSGNRLCSHCNCSIPVNAIYCTECGAML